MNSSFISSCFQHFQDLVYEEILLYHFEDFRKEYLQKVAAGENPFKEVINNENALKVIIPLLVLRKITLIQAWRKRFR